jgi:hypothetical protein
MSWWDFGEWAGTSGGELATYQIDCAFCGERGHFETIAHLEKKKPGGSKALNYDTLKCGHCGNLMFAFWSAAAGMGGRGIHSYRLLPWHQSTTSHPDHWPNDVGHYWVEARRSVAGSAVRRTQSNGEHGPCGGIRGSMAGDDCVSILKWSPPEGCWPALVGACQAFRAALPPRLDWPGQATNTFPLRTASHGLFTAD